MSSKFDDNKCVAKHQITKNEWEKVVHPNQLVNRLKCVDKNKIQYIDSVDCKKLETEKEHIWEEKFIDFKNNVEDNSQFHGKNYCASIQVNDKSKYSNKQHVAQEDSSKTLEKLPLENNNLNCSINKNEENGNECCRKKRKRCEMNSNSVDCKFQGTGLTCVGILPGLGIYEDSSDDSDQSCSSNSEINENIRYDLVGRPLVYQSKAESR